MRSEALSQITGDHSIVADLLRSGQLSEQDAKTHPDRHVLTRALGVAPDVQVDIAAVPCETGDRLLLCTDGLFKALTVDELAVALASDSEPQRLADDLVSSAVRADAEDNVTVLVMDLQQEADRCVTSSRRRVVTHVVPSTAGSGRRPASRR